MLENISYWDWLALGIILLIVETLLGSVFLLALVVPAFCVAILSWTFQEISFNQQLLIFSFISLSTVIYLFFKQKRDSKNPGIKLNQRLDSHIGQEYILLADTKNNFSTIKANGTTWQVKCDKQLSAGDLVKVISVKDNNLVVMEVGDVE